MVLFAKIFDLFYFTQIFIFLILTIKLCNTSPWSYSLYNHHPYGGSEVVNSNFWNRLPPAMTNYGHFGQFHGNAGVQGFFFQ
jgi:hypothetical protein